MGFDDGDLQDAELELLARAQQQGAWGFTIDALQVTGITGAGTFQPPVSVLTVTLPSFMARMWTLNLLAFQYQTNQPPSTQGLVTTNGQPPRNQTFNAKFKARVDYGVDGALESVQFDYPSSGCTVQFAAATFRVYLVGTGVIFGAPPPPVCTPMLGGFVTPTAKGASSQDKLPSVMFTEARTTVTNPGGTKFFWCPPKARGYRLIPVDATSTALTMVVRQLDFGQNNLSLDWDNGWFEPYAVANGSALVQLRNGNDFVPLLPDTQGISVALAAAGSGDYFVQWLLDI